MNKNVFNRTSIQIDKTDEKITIAIPPLYKWKSHSNYFYYFLFIYIIFTISNFTFILFDSIYGYSNLFCLIASCLFNRQLAGIVLNIQLILFIPLLSLASNSENYMLITIGVLCLIENLILGDIRNMLIRETIFATYIEIETTKCMNIKSHKFSISKKLGHIWQSDLLIKNKNVQNKEKINIDILMKINLNALFNRLRILCVLGSKNSKKIDTYSLIKNKTYFFGAWLNSQEKENLSDIIKSQ